MGLFEQMVQRNMQDTYNPQKVELLQNRMNTLEGSTMSPGRKARLMGEAARGLGALGEQVDFSKFSGLSPGNLSPGRADHLNAMQMGMQMNNMDFNAKREMEDARMASSVYNNRFARGGMLPKRRGLYLADGTARISDAQAAADADRICKTYGVCDPKPAPAPAPQAAPQPAPRVAPQPQKPNPFGGLLGKMVDAVNGSRKQLEDVNNYAQGGLLPDITKPFRKLGDAAGRVVDQVRQGAETIRQATPRQRVETASEGLGGMAGEAAEKLRNREETVRQHLRDAEGYASGGIVRGPGGPEDDEVPMEIGGVPVNLSDQEAVLPAKTVRALGGAKAVERLIEMTNEKPPVEGGLRAGGRYTNGGVFENIPGRYPIVERAMPNFIGGREGMIDQARLAAEEARRAASQMGAGERWSQAVNQAKEATRTQLPAVQQALFDIPPMEKVVEGEVVGSKTMRPDQARLPAPTAPATPSIPQYTPVVEPVHVPNYPPVSQTAPAAPAAQPAPAQAVPKTPVVQQLPQYATIESARIPAYPPSPPPPQTPPPDVAQKTPYQGAAQQARAAGGMSPEAAAFEQARAAQEAGYKAASDAGATNKAGGYQRFAKEGWGSTPISETGLGKGAKWATRKALDGARWLEGKTSGLAGTAGVALEGLDVVDVATDPNKTKLDVATQASRGVGGLAAAGLGAKAGAMAGALGGPFAPVTVPLGAFVGGGLGYLGANKLMDLGGDAPAADSKGFVRHLKDKVLGNDEVPTTPTAPASATATQAVPTAATTQATPAQAAPATPEQAAAEAARQNAMSIADVNKRGFDKAVDTWNMQRDYGFADGPDVMANTNQNLRAMAENKPLMHNTMGEGIGRMDEWNRIQDKAGTGIRAQAIVGKDGRKQVMFSDSGVVKPQYIGADGQPTNEWNKTTAYREATARAASDKQTAADIEAKRELEHNWGPKMGGLLHRALRNQEAAAQAKNALSPMDRFNMEKGVAEFNRNVKNDEFNRTKATAEHEAKLDDTYDKSVKTAAQMYGEKEAPQTEAALRRYIDFNAKRAGKPPREFAAEAIENFHLEKALDTGQRWNVIDKPWDGVTNSRWKYVGDSTGLADMFNGIGGDHRFVDESTGRTIGYRDIKKMPEAHQKIFLGTKVIDGNGNPINMWTRMQKGK